MKKQSLAKKEKALVKTQAESLMFQTLRKASSLYPSIDDTLMQRLKKEVDWFAKQHFAKGVLMARDIVEKISATFSTSIGEDDGFLSGSVVAYSLGLTLNDPIAAGKETEVFSSDEDLHCLNIRIRLCPDIRNAAVEVAEAMYGKSMMRMGVPIMRLDNVILEFQRDMKRMR